MRRLFITLLAVAAAVLILFAPASTAEDATNDVPFDLESGIGLAFIGGLQVFNLYWDNNWNDAGHNDGFSTGSIDAATKALADSNYFDKLGQYGVPDITWGGSATAVSFPCGGDPGTTVSSLAIVGFMLCEEITPFDGVPLATGIPIPIPLVPNPTGHTIYNIILPRKTTVDDFGSKSCIDYGAYHFQIPSILGFPIYYSVIPSKCASSVSKLMPAMAHEMVEAATDPMPLFHWIDESTRTPGVIGFFSSIPGLLKAGEVADVCSSANPATSSPFGDVPVTLNGVSMDVASYWSNHDNACMVGPSRVVQAHFTTSGLSGTSATLHIGGENVTVSPGSTVTRILLEGTSFSFDDVIAGPKERFLATGASCSGTVPFQTGNTTANASVTLTCAFEHQFLVTFDQSGIPPATAWHVTVDGTTLAGPTSVWRDTGSSISFSYESPVADATDAQKRYVLTGTSTPSPLVVSTAATVIGTYQTQYLLTVRTSGLGTNTTSVRNGATLLGVATDASPMTVWLPSGTALALNVDEPVNGANGVEYFFRGFQPAPPATLTSGFTTTAKYETMSQLIDDALASGGITPQTRHSVAGALKRAFDATQTFLNLHLYALALRNLEAFIGITASESGNNVTPATATELELLAAEVYHYALCQGVAAGQIDAFTHATKYAYYANLVTSLGQTPLPDC